jgi:anti-sigma regulatory factor (Ser/Thr protein kinase)
MVRTSGWTHETVLDAEPVSVAKARDFVSAHLLDHRLPQLADDVRLVVSELATNAMVHAGTPFTVTLTGLERSVMLTVRDGSPLEPVPVPVPVPAPAAVHQLDPGGRGLLIVDMVSRTWGFDTGEDRTKSVWASFDIRVMEPSPG